MDNSLQILSESLDEKIKVLLEIQEYNLAQEKAFLDGQADLDTFDEAMEKNETLIQKLEKLDDGFELLYERIAKQLEQNKDAYKDQIKVLQKKIGEITDLSVSIQTQEVRNKKLVEEFFTHRRRTINQTRRGSKAAMDYYKSMNGTGYDTSRFMDSKN